MHKLNVYLSTYEGDNFPDADELFETYVRSQLRLQYPEADVLVSTGQGNTKVFADGMPDEALASEICQDWWETFCSEQDLDRGALKHGSFRGDVSIAEDISAWETGPVGHHRDSGLLAESNWEVTLARLEAVDPEGLDHCVLNYGHFAVGWVEEIATRPGSQCAAIAAEIARDLESYPVLDEDHFCNLEHEAFMENLPQILRDLRHTIYQFDLSEDLESRLESLTDDQLWEVAADLGESSEGWHTWTSSNVVEIIERLMVEVES